mmetsp:Transcript_11630/g.22892  ORF Transcript_11630/g.22892 Transcript_11630/m.22892 type:complete len:117 (+) Transcript_11630:147-497(+)
MGDRQGRADSRVQQRRGGAQPFLRQKAPLPLALVLREIPEAKLSVTAGPSNARLAISPNYSSRQPSLRVYSEQQASKPCTMTGLLESARPVSTLRRDESIAGAKRKKSSLHFLHPP